MTGLRTDPTIILLLVTFATTMGCGVMPPGQGRTRTFNVSGFTLPVAMVYSATPDARVSGIATDMDQAQGFVSRLVMQTVFDVLERQGRSALLPDAVISGILGQLEIKTTYVPMNCQKLLLDLTMDEVDEAKPQNCIITDNTVTGVCNKSKGGGDKKCDTAMVEAVPDTHRKISGTLSTTNIIMANWSQAMWQNIVNRAVRILASGLFERNFFAASVTVG
ncbi:hypothetical protein KIN20_016296 [Parelaphostrongylus tenuis]|uniref:Secreted protein n=1 Tax=Parelaphostrongylus tenuis TaxID=148309 RepID=A0AAD5QQL7_PARTN|nr:hypothetical protein KIN20_016296 [Parelaphostrongylus tenuis]